MLVFSGVQLYQIAVNKTQIESLDNYGYIKVGESVLKIKINLYDFGWRRNFDELFGFQDRFWWLPLRIGEGDGYEWKIMKRGIVC